MQVGESTMLVTGSAWIRKEFWLSRIRIYFGYTDPCPDPDVVNLEEC